MLLHRTCVISTDDTRGQVFVYLNIFRAHPSENCAGHEESYQGEVGWHCSLISKVRFGVRSSVPSS